MFGFCAELHLSNLLTGALATAILSWSDVNVEVGGFGFRAAEVGGVAERGEEGGRGGLILYGFGFALLGEYHGFVRIGVGF